ncbi:MAG: ABC transporter permease, partial [Bacilli bacterium]
GVSYKVGDTLTVDLGSREGSYFKTDDLKLVNNLRLQEDEELKIKETKTYKIVGIMERSVYESHYAPGYTVLSTIPQNINNDNLASSFITYKKVKDVKKKTVNIVSNLKNANNNKVEADYHNSLLTFYGESSYDNINASLGMVIGVMLTVLMVGCAIVIYNSFAISVMERKKQFGLLASIGSTKKQTKHMVFFEAFIVSIIGIPLGVLAGILGIYFVLLITDKLIPLLFSVPLHLSLYPTFVIIPIIYMLLTIILSAYLPSRRASKVTPIEAIRQSNDIKISKREVRTFGFTKYLFGSEAYIASKNMKRNRKKYRITILSLIVSIVLFISASTLVKLGNQSISGILNTINFDIFITGGDDNPQLLKQLTQVDGVTYAFITNNYNFNLDLKSPNLTSNYVDKFHRQEEAEISFVSINDEEFNNLLKLNNIKYNESAISELEIAMKDEKL